MIEKYEDLYKTNLFSISEIKGIDFDKIVIYNIYEGADQIPVLNGYYTALTRAINNIYWIEDGNNFQHLQKYFNLEEGVDFVNDRLDIKRKNNKSSKSFLRLVSYEQLIQKFENRISENNKKNEVLIDIFDELEDEIKKRNPKLDFENRRSKRIVVEFIDTQVNEFLLKQMNRWELIEVLYCEKNNIYSIPLNFYKMKNQKRMLDYKEEYLEKNEINESQKIFIQCICGNINKKDYANAFKKSIGNSDLDSKPLEDFAKRISKILKTDSCMREEDLELMLFTAKYVSLRDKISNIKNKLVNTLEKKRSK